MTLRVLVVFVALLIVLSGCYPPVPAPLPAQPSGAGSPPAASPQAVTSPTKITLAMGYIPSVQFAPFYVAQKRGYFREAGLDVTFQYGFETDLLKLIGTNQSQFMIGSGEQVILARSQDLPVRYAMRWYRKFPVVLFASKSSNITKPEDLVGKRLGTSALSGADYIGWLALVYVSGMDQSKVSVQAIGYTQASAVSQGRVDAAMDYVVNGPVQLRLAGQEVTVISVSDFIDLPSNGIITNDQTIREKPQLVQALVTATMKGLQDTLSEPDAAFSICLEAVPEAGGEQARTNRAIFDQSLLLWQAPKDQLGRSDPAVWDAAAKFMRKVGLITRDVQVADLFTNQFVGGK